MYKINATEGDVISLDYNTYNIPDKYTILSSNRSEIATTGWVGSSEYNNSLHLLGLPSVSGPGQGSLVVVVPPGASFVYIVVQSISNASAYTFTATIDSVVIEVLATEEGIPLLSEADEYLLAG